jgi:hypothetical protein
MSDDEESKYVLIRDSSILVRVPQRSEVSEERPEAEFFDVRTGVQIKMIHPPLLDSELERGYALSRESANAIIDSGAKGWLGPSVDFTNVVSILEIRQRKLDTVVASSVLDQLRTITEILQEFLKVCETAQNEEKLWLSQQVLSLIGKFSGRELEELEEIIEWFKTKPRK